MAAPIALQLTNDHGFVLAVVIWDILVHHVYMAFKVVVARKKYGVKYPDLYAPHGHKNRKEYDCVQRAHQNSLENQPAFLALLLLAGLKYPISASLTGAAYLVGRVVYFAGYSSGNPNSRLRGGFMHIAYIVLMGMVVRWAVELLMPLVTQA